MTTYPIAPLMAAANKSAVRDALADEKYCAEIDKAVREWVAAVCARRHENPLTIPPKES